MNDTTFQGNGSVKYVPVVVDTKPKPITNADRIRSMSDEELAEMFWLIADCEHCPNRKRHCSNDCKGAWLAWLKQEAEAEK